MNILILILILYHAGSGTLQPLYVYCFMLAATHFNHFMFIVSCWQRYTSTTVCLLFHAGSGTLQPLYVYCFILAAVHFNHFMLIVSCRQRYTSTTLCLLFHAGSGTLQPLYVYCFMLAVVHFNHFMCIVSCWQRHTSTTLCLLLLRLDVIAAQEMRRYSQILFKHIQLYFDVQIFVRFREQLLTCFVQFYLCSVHSSFLISDISQLFQRYLC